MTESRQSATPLRNDGKGYIYVGLGRPVTPQNYDLLLRPGDGWDGWIGGTEWRGPVWIYEERAPESE